MNCRILAKRRDGSEASWNVSWRLDEVESGHEKQSFQSASMIFEQGSFPIAFSLQDEGARLLMGSGEGTQTELYPINLGHPNAFNFLIETLEATIVAGSVTPAAIKLVTPLGRGNIIRSDLIPQRMQDLEYIEKATAFAHPLQQFSGEGWTASSDFETLFKESIGAIRLHHSRDIEGTLHVLKSELCNRLPDPVVVPGLKRRTIAFIDGNEARPYRGGYGSQFYGAAEAMGVDVVVLAVEGHWLQGPQYSYWRNAFIPISLDADEDFPRRIVEGVRKYNGHVDSIMTIFDSFQVSVSKAAEELGLLAEPASAYEVITDKYSTSVHEGRKSFKVASHEEAMHVARTEDITWPIIVKPCRGFASELVFKVDDIEQLATTAGRINGTARHGTEFVMEPYCDGPEVDINFVMYDGQVLFWQIGDENPKTADDGADSFSEVDCCLPSELPKMEQQVLHNSIVQSLLKLGFRNGLWHCEARVSDSALEWRLTESGVPEVVLGSGRRGKEPSSFLIECNPRPPGINASDIVETTWGVDYWAVLLSIRLHEEQRVRALSQPFRRGPAYFSDMVFISAAFDISKQGIWESGEVTEELCQQRPDLAKYISKHLTYMRKGDKAPHPSTGVNTFVAYLNVYSHVGRNHVLEIAAEVRREIFKLIEWS